MIKCVPLQHLAAINHIVRSFVIAQHIELNIPNKNKLKSIFSGLLLQVGYIDRPPPPPVFKMPKISTHLLLLIISLLGYHARIDAQNIGEYVMAMPACLTGRLLARRVLAAASNLSLVVLEK